MMTWQDMWSNFLMPLLYITVGLATGLASIVIVGGLCKAFNWLMDKFF